MIEFSRPTIKWRRNQSPEKPRGGQKDQIGKSDEPSWSRASSVSPTGKCNHFWMGRRSDDKLSSLPSTVYCRTSASYRVLLWAARPALCTEVNICWPSHQRLSMLLCPLSYPSLLKRIFCVRREKSERERRRRPPSEKT